jgi:hypothetical protein
MHPLSILGTKLAYKVRKVPMPKMLIKRKASEGTNQTNTNDNLYQ